MISSTEHRVLVCRGLFNVSSCISVVTSARGLANTEEVVCEVRHGAQLLGEQTGAPRTNSHQNSSFKGLQL
jgi:hypothetical protein